jgi:hypothetical protein
MLVRKALELKPVVRKHMFIPFLFLFLFILFYPMAISIYVVFPFFIGTMAYVFIEGLDKEKYLAIFVSVIYFINLEVNLSLPLFFILIVSALFYILFYPLLGKIKRCKQCKGIIVVIFVNIIYFLGLYFYDFLFETKSIVFDSMLLYSLLVDMLVVMVL